MDSTILKIRALTDDHETGRKKDKDSNLSLQHLVFISEVKKIKGLHADWVKLREKCKPIRNHSNKRIGHHDFDHALGKTASGMEFPEITDSVASMAAFVLKFHGDVRNAEWVSMPIVGAEDEKQFLWTLLLGNQMRNTLDEEAILRRITKNSPDFHKFSHPLWLGTLDPFAELFDF